MAAIAQLEPRQIIGPGGKFLFDTTPDFQCLVDRNHWAYDTRYKGWHGGRGSGKSTQMARGALYRGMQQKLRILGTREYQNSINDSVMTLLADQIKILGLQDFYEVQKTQILGKNGTEFKFAGLRHSINSIKSMEGIDLCMVEEAQTVSEFSWRTLIPTIRKEGSQIWLCFNPYQESDPTYKRFVALPPPNSFIRQINYDRNPWMPNTLLEEMEYDKQRDRQLYLHVWEGHCLKRTESLVFKHWTVDETIAPDEDEHLFFGSDFGFAKDPTTLVRMWIDDESRKIYIDREAWGVGVEIDDTPALYDQVMQGERKWKITGDSARPETISYLSKNGGKDSPGSPGIAVKGGKGNKLSPFRMVGAKKGSGSVEEGVKFLQNYEIVVHPRCKRVIAELGSYSYKTDQSTGEILPILLDDNNHCIDAIRYGLESRWNRTRVNIG